MYTDIMIVLDSECSVSFCGLEKIISAMIVIDSCYNHRDIPAPTEYSE